jgi:isoamylase
MFYMGDEYGHTKSGNNNTYCHDNYVSPIWLRIFLNNYL